MGISIGVYVFFLSFSIGRVLFHGCVNVNMDILPVCVYIYRGKMNKQRYTAKPKLDIINSNYITPNQQRQLS